MENVGQLRWFDVKCEGFPQKLFEQLNVVLCFLLSFFIYPASLFSSPPVYTQHYAHSSMFITLRDPAALLLCHQHLSSRCPAPPSLPFIFPLSSLSACGQFK